MRAIRLALLFWTAALAAAASTADAGVLITIDKASQRMTVAVDGATRWTWPVSTGRRGFVTPSGSYTEFRMEREHFSKEWDDAPMPHSIFFHPARSRHSGQLRDQAPRHAGLARLRAAAPGERGEALCTG